MSRPEGSAAAGLARSAGSVSIAVFCSRILGLVREQVLAGLFGAGNAMDAFVVAFRIPNLLRDLFAEGALSSAFVTVFTEYEKSRSSQQTMDLVSNVLSVLTVVVSALVFLGMIFSHELVHLMAPDFSLVAGKIKLTTDLTLIMFPFLTLVSVSALFMGILNTRGYFFVPAMASSCFNLSSIVIGGGLALLMPAWGGIPIYGMAVGTLLGGLSQLGIQWPLIRKMGLKLRPRIDLSDPGLRRIGRLIVPAVIGLSATQINIFVNTNFASRCAEGSVAWLNYAFRLMQFPIGLFGVALSVATLPVVARQAVARELKPLGDTLVSSLTLAFALTVPAAVGLWVLAEPIVQLIFQHGRFSPHDTLMTAQAVKFYTIGLMAYSAVKIIVPVYYSLDDTKWPVIASFVAVAANIVFILLTLDILQHRAIALSTSVTMILNFLLLSVILYKKIGGYPLARLLSSILKITLCSAVMGIMARYGWETFQPMADQGLLGLCIALLAVICLSALVYGILVTISGVPELTSLAQAVFQRFKGDPEKR